MIVINRDEAVCRGGTFGVTIDELLHFENQACRQPPRLEVRSRQTSFRVHGDGLLFHQDRLGRSWVERLFGFPPAHAFHVQGSDRVRWSVKRELALPWLLAQVKPYVYASSASLLAAICSNQRAADAHADTNRLRLLSCLRSVLNSIWCITRKRR